MNFGRESDFGGKKRWGVLRASNGMQQGVREKSSEELEREMPGMPVRAQKRKSQKAIEGEEASSTQGFRRRFEKKGTSEKKRGQGASFMGAESE